MPVASSYDHELIIRVSQGDEKAFRQLFNRYWDNVYSVAFAFTKSSVFSEEIVQDVFLKIWLKREHLASVTKFNAYLFTVAKNHIYNELRKKTAEQPFVEHLNQHFLESSALPEQQLLVKETKQLINKAVRQLPGQQQAVYELSRNEGLDHAAIAERLSISKLTVKSHMTKALRFIRHYLQVHDDMLLIVSCIVHLLIF